MSDSLTVGQLREYLASVDPDAEVCFLGETWRGRALSFYRTKMRGDNLVQIELSEIEESVEEPPPEPDDVRTPSAGELLGELCGLADDCEVTFGSTLDAVPLLFEVSRPGLVVRLRQTQRPEWTVRTV